MHKAVKCRLNSTKFKMNSLLFGLGIDLAQKDCFIRNNACIT
jgi:hypothetical protein